MTRRACAYAALLGTLAAHGACVPHLTPTPVASPNAPTEPTAAPAANHGRGVQIRFAGNVAFDIVEGRRFRVERITVEDERAPPSEARGGSQAMRERIAVKDGDWVDRNAVADGIAKLRLYYGDQGYAFVDVIPDSQIDEAHATVKLVLRVKRGPVATVESVRIASARGKLDRLSEAEAKELVRISSGTIYNETKVLQAMARLRAHANVRSAEVSTGPGSAEDRVVITFAIEERPP